MENVILSVNHLSKSFGAHKVLADVDFEVKKGDVVSIIGASGSGKSSLLRCIQEGQYRRRKQQGVSHRSTCFRS